MDMELVNGTLTPKNSGEMHVVSLALSLSWLPANDDAHDVYFALYTWNEEGHASNRSNVAAANFFAAVRAAPPSFWADLFDSPTAMHICTVLLALVLVATVVLIVAAIYRKQRQYDVSGYNIAVFRTAPMKAEIEKACRKSLLAQA